MKSKNDYLNYFREAASLGKPFKWMGEEVFITREEVNRLSQHVVNYTYHLSDGNIAKFKMINMKEV